MSYGYGGGYAPQGSQQQQQQQGKPLRLSRSYIAKRPKPFL